MSSDGGIINIQVDIKYEIYYGRVEVGHRVRVRGRYSPRRWMTCREYLCLYVWMYLNYEREFMFSSNE